MSSLIRTKLNQVLDWVACLCVRIFFLALGRLPRRLSRGLCESLAVITCHLDARHRRIGMINLSIAFPERDETWKRRVLKDSYRELGRMVAEISRIHRIDAAHLSKVVEYEAGRGLENYEAARRQGRGVLFLTAHVSAWELLPLAHAAAGHPLSFIVRPLDNPRLDRWIARLRARFGNQTVPKQQSLRRVLRLLKEGRDVGMLIDQNVQPRDGVFVPLFGIPACTTSSLAALALKSGAPVVPGFIHPAGAGRYQIRFYPPLEVTPSGDRERDILEYTARFNQFIEAVVREFPHCWLWGHRRFLTQPDGRDPYRV